MAQQEEPLYDFPEPSQLSEQKRLGRQRVRGSLRSISVLDRLLLTVPVWLQLSINPATALHILQREPPGTFLVRKSRTSQRNVLCVRLADKSVPSFVQQFGIREEQSSKTLCLETSAISFPDLPRLISFYCVSRDVLPFPLELPEAIAKASSHKELESISHMGIEFWNSHLNVRGPREAPKPNTAEQKKPDILTSAPQKNSANHPDPVPQPDSDKLLETAPESTTATDQPGQTPTLFNEFCPITTRSPVELDCGSGLGALCFINPLFLQSMNALSRRRMFKRSLKVRLSTEPSTMLSPPLLPPPPPPLLPKTKKKCRGALHISKSAGLLQDGNQAMQIDPTVQDTQTLPMETQVQRSSSTPDFHPWIQELQGQMEAGLLSADEAQLPTVMEHLTEESDYMQPSPVISSLPSASLSPYLSPSLPPLAPPPLLPKMSSRLSPHDSPVDSPSSLSPYQSPSISPKVPFSLSPYASPSASPSISPNRSPSPFPKSPPSLSPFNFLPSFPEPEQVYATPTPAVSRPDQQRSARAGADDNKDEEQGTAQRREEEALVLKMNAAALNDMDSCSSSSSLEGAAETPPRSPHKQDSGTSLERTNVLDSS